jgi:hypothetical protein
MPSGWLGTLPMPRTQPAALAPWTSAAPASKNAFSRLPSADPSARYGGPTTADGAADSVGRPAGRVAGQDQLDWPTLCSAAIEDDDMSTAAGAFAPQPTTERARCTARSLIYLADLGTVPELVESSIANLRLLSAGADRGRFSMDKDNGLQTGIDRLLGAIAQRTLGLNLAEDRLLRIGLSLLESTPQYAAALPDGAPLPC